MKKLLLIIFLLYILPIYSQGQIVVTKGTFPTLCNGSTTWSNQSTDIILAETNPNDFSTGSCYFVIQSVPFTIFNSAAGQVQFAVNGDITTGSISICCNQVITVSYTCPTNTKIDTIRIRGLQLQSINGAPASFDVTKQTNVSCTQNGFVAGQSVMTVNTNNNYADFTLPSPQQFCPNAAPYQLVGNPAGGVFSGSGVIGSYFYPTSVSAGSHPITYSTGNACNSTITKSVSIIPLKPSLTTNKDSICQGESITFTALGQTPFVFFKNNVAVQGPGTNNKYVTTQLASGDAIHVSSAYMGCTNYSDTITIPVNATPIVDFTISDYCAGTTNTFSSNSTIPYGTSTVSNVKWYMDVSTYYPSGSSVNHIFPSYGNHTVKSIVTLSTGCTAEKDSTFYMGPYPKAYYSWLNTCGTNDVSFVDTSKIAAGSITQWNWDFDINSTTDVNSSVQNTTYTFPAPNSYNSRLIVTSDLGCKDTLTRRVTTLQGITITKSSPYIGDFNVAKSGWDFGDDSLTTWDWSTFLPNTFKATQIISNQPVWHTGNTTNGFYNTNERSFLNSPCFNFANLTKPMIAIKMAMDTDPSTAGAILEASIDGGVTWDRVGNMDEGVAWYNNSGNDGRPGGYAKYPDNIVWSGHYDTSSAINTFNGWRVAKVKLDSLAGLNAVRFRIAFGAANSGVTKYTGIAIDSIWIGDRNKMLVLENFTQTYIVNDGDGGPILAAKNAVDYIRDQRKKDVAPIYYHCSFPRTDMYNPFYSAGPSSRVLYYGVTSVPRTVLDGNYYNGATYTGGSASARLDVGDVDARILERANFRLDVSATFNSGIITANSKIVYINPSVNYSSDIVLHTVITEDSANGDNRFSSVARQMLPDAAGDYISRNWTLNDSITLSHSWNYGTLSPSKLSVVNFIQKASTKEVLQAVYVRAPGNSGIPVILDVSNEIVDNSEILVFPNPADNEINIVSLSEGKNIENWILIDNLGREVKSGKPEHDAKSIIFNTNDISNGFHCLRINVSNGQSVLKKILINH